MSNVVAWFEIYVEDMDRAAGFYTAVIGKELTDLPSPDEGQMKAFPMEEGAPNASGALVKHPMGQPGAGGTMVYFYSEDVATEIGRVADAGGKVLMEKTSIGPYGFIAMFEDTEGNCVGLHSMA
ncbi:MAG: VOC family protein [Pyrinomonadaceae bacterium]